MILISSRLDDISTSNVIDWLYYQGKDYLRFNGDSFDALFSYRNNVLYFKSNYRDIRGVKRDVKKRVFDLV